LEVTAADFRQHFELLSDEALLDTNRDELVEVAQQCFDEEVARRGLNETGEIAETAGEAAGLPVSSEDALVLLATFVSGDEVNLARGLLEGAGIPSRVVNPLAALGGVELRLLVPAEFEEHALEILAMQISDEDLAAQAEAAGMDELQPVEPDDSIEEN
jgi:Putative prokaryotic signal transducing protein